MNTAPIFQDYLRRFDVMGPCPDLEPDLMVDETSLLDQPHHFGFELMAEVVTSPRSSRVDLCEPCIQALRRLETQDQLLDRKVVNPTLVLDAIDDALEVLVALNEKVLKAQSRKASMNNKNIDRTHALTQAISLLIDQISTKLKVQLDAQAPK